MNHSAEEVIVHQFPCLSDNYGYLLHDTASSLTAAIDTPDAVEIERQLNDKGWHLDVIYNTHHHHDHVGGNLALQAHYQCDIYASQYDARRIPGITHTLKDGDVIELGHHQIDILFTPGHTLGHILYYFRQQNMLFCGDTIFAMGCGRLFEGSPEDMWQSLNRIMHLPDETVIYCAHEYTLANANFANAVLPENKDILRRKKDVERLRDENIATIPTTLAVEKQTNPFLLAGSQETKDFLALSKATDEACFKHLRQLKDNF